MDRLATVMAMVMLAPGVAAQQGARGRSSGSAPGTVVVKPQARAPGEPAWSKGIVPLRPENYYNAIECGKTGGADPACVFWDTGLCKNDDFAIAMYTPYKQVAYEVWTAVKNRQPAPTPNYQAASQTRVTIGVTQARGSKNVLTNLLLKRGTTAMPPVDRSTSGGGGRFTFDFPAFAATGDVTLELVGKDRTISCTIDRATLQTFR